MSRKEMLLQRLDAVGASLERTGKAEALLGHGSVGVELDRLDDLSDLDFFAIVRPGYKREFIDNLWWLSDIAPIAYAFINSADGYKLLYEDGIFCEFAVFERSELPGIAYAESRVVWKTEDFDESLRFSAKPPAPAFVHSVEWIAGEMITNLYVGLCRFRRGEKLSAFRFVQEYAVDRLIELIGMNEKRSTALADGFAPTRRFEQAYPQLSTTLSGCMQGIDRTPESARAIIAAAEKYTQFNERMKRAVMEIA